jgi:5-methylthioadenosine/S-adenosylhomocysteine deaminase
MQRVDTLLRGGTVVTMNEQFDLFADGAVAIQGSHIVAVGPTAEIEAAYTAETVVDCAGQYVLPGLVNAHTHIPMTLLRGLADDLRLDVWLLGYMMPTEREFVTPAFCRLGAQLACAEMMRSGVTAFADMYYFESDVAAATAQAGLRGVLGQCVLKFPAPDAESYTESLALTRQFIQQWQGHPLIVPAIAPHAPYSLTDDIMRQCAALAQEYDVPLLIHLAETRAEVDDSIREFGAPVIERVQGVHLFDAKVLAAHCVHISSAEMRTLHATDTTVAHCPTSNLKLASGIAPVAEMLKHDLTVGIGTDGPASNNDLDMFEEMRLAAILAKTQANDPTVLPARQALLMATRMGAAALYLDDITGSLEAGKRADVIAMDAHVLHNLPQFERDSQAVYSRIVYAGHASDVRHVWCDGRWLMRDRQVLTVDEPTVLAEAQVLARQIDDFLRQREENLLSKLLAIGGLERREGFEVQAKTVLYDERAINRLLEHPGVTIVRHSHRRQYDTYFLFDDESQGRLRYREDDDLDATGTVVSTRTRLTLTVPQKERAFNHTALLSRSRFYADADRPLRFYREYFRPRAERVLVKDRRRWHIDYKGERFYINLDRVTQPVALPDAFAEIKATTWSAQDAEEKAGMIRELLALLDVEQSDIVTADYLDLVSEAP